MLVVFLTHMCATFPPKMKTFLGAFLSDGMLCISSSRLGINE